MRLSCRGLSASIAKRRAVLAKREAPSVLSLDTPDLRESLSVTVRWYR
jgi:hypothetical protein